MPVKKRIELDDAHGRAMAMEEFVLHLHRGSELLRTNHPKDAQRHMTLAFNAQSDDSSGQATLALVYFKLGLYPRAIEILTRLNKDHPEEPVLMLNLALVLFKTGHTIEAKKILENLVVLSPDYRKAHGYLGLAHQRLGDYHKAQDSFRKAGAEHMASRMARFVEPLESLGPDAPLDSPEDRLPSIPPPPNENQSVQAEPPVDRSSQAPPFLANPPLPLAESPRILREPLPVSELTSRSRLSEPLEGRFLISDAGYLLVNVAHRVLSRLDGLHFCSSEGLSYRPLMRKRRGDNKEEPFGIENLQVYDIEGNGRLGFHPGEGVFSAVSLGEEIAYFREDLVFAFDPDLKYENGVLPGGETPLTHFSGRGSIVFKTPVATHALEVTPDRGVIIPAQGLAGWFGRLLPRKSSSNGPFDPSLEALEFIGEGVLFFCLE